ncbi:carboxylesterase/lipase family protein [Streptomyces spinoverrucosus]|uniref:carboxylesterase/lipase family protein n=1 Tax=Streptomyces spinoverrucosus TaxID=284043 RepID=UPI0018C43048|nr:carboxylesterase family protein [Streptomyces spinoverrucosus]MBG0851396.1 carboxylesterase/lipase family protein [Streptomyces spinoverrucosus]
MTGIEGRTVNTDRGKVSGVAEGGVVSFRGIPYAASPVGELRFAPPQPHPGWTDVREAVQAGPSVPQAASRLEKVQGQRVPDWNEDGSLTVNVFTPRRALEDGAARPVLVWWHGGGFTSGSGGWDWYDGGRLAALGDIVVVTANYRLGPLGYLYLPEIGAANLGPQDQAAVLRWVQDNIASFGGDPRTVTVGGQSAGAYSALMLALDPATNDSITRVLLQSGPFGLNPQDAHQAAEHADAYLRLLGIPAGTDTAKALRALPVEQLLDAYGRLSVQLAAPGNAAPPMYPVLGAPGLPRTRQQALADGDLEGKALLIGTTRDEATAFFAFDPRIQNLTTTDALDVLTAQIGRQAAQDVYQQHAARLPQASPAEIFTAVQTDGLFRDGSLQIADHHAAGGNTTYVYEFDHAPAEDPYALGATHCAELPFLFGTFDAYPGSPVLAGAGDAERALGREFATVVAEFVTAGTAGDCLPYAPATAARIRHFG